MDETPEKPNISEAVELLLGRMKSHPEEFLVPLNPVGARKTKHYDFVSVFDPFMNEDERKAVKTAIHDIAMNICNEQLMHKLLQGDSPDVAVDDGMATQSPNIFLQAQAMGQSMANAKISQLANVANVGMGGTGLSSLMNPSPISQRAQLDAEYQARQQRLSGMDAYHFGPTAAEPPPKPLTIKQKLHNLLLGK